MFKFLNKILNNLKRAISILLVLMLLFNSAGYVIVFFQLKSYFKKEARSKLENFINKNDLATIELTKAEFDNQNEEFYFVEPHEIMYHGKMYDISRIEYESDKVKIIGICDENETNLNELFSMYFAKSLNDKYSRAASIVNTLISDAGLPLKYDGIYPTNKDICYEFIFFPIFGISIDIPTPPPKNRI